MSCARTAGGAVAGAVAGHGLGCLLITPLVYLLGVQHDGQAMMLIFPLWMLLVPLGLLIGAAAGATQHEREPAARVQF